MRQKVILDDKVATTKLRRQSCDDKVSTTKFLTTKFLKIDFQSRYTHRQNFYHLKILVAQIRNYVKTFCGENTFFYLDQEKFYLDAKVLLTVMFLNFPKNKE